MYQPKDQAAFEKSYNTTEHIKTVEKLIEMAMKFNIHSFLKLQESFRYCRFLDYRARFKNTTVDEYKSM